MTTEILEPMVKRLRVDVYGNFVAKPDEGSAPCLEPTIRLYPITITGQFENGAYFEGGIPWSAITNLVDDAKTERDKAAARYGLEISEIDVEYHDMNTQTVTVAIERPFNVIRRFMENIKEIYADLRRKI